MSDSLALVFTDIEGSSRLWEAHPVRFHEAVAAHDALLREACAACGGDIISNEGDAFFCVFPDPAQALQFALQAQEQLREYPWDRHLPAAIRVRIGLHFGRTWQRDDNHFGPEVNRAARICDAGHGGQILASEAFMSACGEPGPEVTIRDLQRHRLRGLAEPERLYQLTLSHWEQQEWPLLRTLDDTPTNLPVQVTSFVGRERELQEIAALLADPQVRLITLAGSGGSGKSRLAQQAAAAAFERFVDGVFWADLTPFSNPESVGSAILDVLKLPVASSLSVVQQVADYARDRQLLLVIDNFEHLMDAADLLGQLITHARGLKLLVTSREVLRVPGEHIQDVGPLDLPDPPINWETLSQYDSVHLFLERARTVAPHFALTRENAAAVAELCRALDGIPLAIELVTSWLREFSVTALLKSVGEAGLTTQVLRSRLRGVSERQRTLASATEWSYRLLSEADRRALRYLSVFEGGLFADSAEAVCGPGGAAAVTSLHDKSLLYCRQVLDQPRYQMLETIRQFAAGKLEVEAETREALTKHARHMAEVGGALDRRLNSPDPGDAFRRAEGEARNLIKSLDTAEELRVSDFVEKSAMPLVALWYDPGVQRCVADLGLPKRLLSWALEHRGESWTTAPAALCNQVWSVLRQWDEAACKADQVVDLVEATGSSGDLFNALRAAAQAALGLGQPGRARGWITRASALATEPGHHAGLCNLLWQSGDIEQAIEEATRACRLCEAGTSADDQWNARYYLAYALVFNLQDDLAAEPLQAALQIARHHLDPNGHHLFHTLNLEIVRQAHLERPGEAQRAAREAIECLDNLPAGATREQWALEHLQKTTEARLWAHALEIMETHFERWPPQTLDAGARRGAAGIAAWVYANLERPSEAMENLRLTLDADRNWDGDPCSAGNGLATIAQVLHVTGHRREAAVAVLLAVRLLERWPMLRERNAELLAMLAEELPPEELRQAQEESERLKPSEAVAQARTTLGI